MFPATAKMSNAYRSCPDMAGEPYEADLEPLSSTEVSLCKGRGGGGQLVVEQTRRSGGKLSPAGPGLRVWRSSGWGEAILGSFNFRGLSEFGGGVSGNDEGARLERDSPCAPY